MWIVVLLGAGLLLVAWLDVLAGLPPWARVGGVLGVGVAGLVLLVWQLALERRGTRPMRLARDVDRVSRSGGQVAAGLDLTPLSRRLPTGAAEAGVWHGPAKARGREPLPATRVLDAPVGKQPVPHGPITRGLARLAVGRAGEIAVALPLEAVEPLRRAGRALKALFLLAAATLALGVFFPRAFRVEFGRLANPWGDQPAYSRHIFEIEPGDTMVVYGDPVDVRVVVRGAPAERLDLMVRPADGGEPARRSPSPLQGEGGDEGWSSIGLNGRAPQTSPYPKGLPGGERVKVGREEFGGQHKGSDGAVQVQPGHAVPRIPERAAAEDAAVPMFQDRDRSWRARLADVTAPLVYWVQAPGGRSERYTIGVIYTPRFEALTVRLTPPAYTNLPPTEGAIPQGGIAGLPGTEVRITATSNRPLSQGVLEFKPDGGDSPASLAQAGPATLVAPAAAELPKAVTWTFPIERPGTLSLALVDERGTRSSSTVTTPVMVLKDNRPVVRVLSPRPHSYATPDVPLPVEIEADDDYGLTSLALYRSLNGTRHLPDRMEVPIPAATRLRREAVLPLRDYGLRPGDVITLFARVEDSDPAGHKGTESGLTQVTIISRELYEQMVRLRKTVADFEARYAAAARRLERLASEAEKALKAARDERGERVSDGTRALVEALAKAVDQAAQETRRAADREPVFALDRDLGETLRQMAEALRGVAESLRRAASATTPDELLKGLEPALRQLAQNRENYQQNPMQGLRRFVQAFDLLAMQQRFIDLYRQQDALAKRMADLKDLEGDDDPTARARMRDLQDEQDALSGQLGVVLEGIRERAMALPDEPDLEKLRRTALEFAEAVAKSRAGPAMRESADHLGGYRGGEARVAAAEAAAVLKSFIKECQGGAGMSAEACRLAFGPSLTSAADLTLGQLLGGMGAGGQQGMGSGEGGYSVRGTSPADVGLYGPMTPQEALGGGEEDADVTAAAFALDHAGGLMDGGLTTERREAVAAQGVPLHAVPPQHRERVQAYFRRVAEETSQGKVAEE